MKAILDYHEKLIKEKGIKKATGFSDNGQKVRFEIIKSQITEQNPLVFDYGCNTADAIPHLGIDPCRYVGMDVNRDFIEFARERFKQAYLMCGDLLNPYFDFIVASCRYDYVLASGVFCYDYGRESKAVNIQIIKRLWEMTGKKLVFNMLKSSSTGNLTYKTSEGVAIAEFLGCNHYSIIQGYLPNDFTVVLRR